MRKIFFVLTIVSLLSIGTFAQKKVVTNDDLEKYKQRRLQTEAEYDREAARRGLPSREELAEREERRQKFLTEFSQKAEAERAQSENYWQNQAFALKTEIAAVEAEINYVRARVGEIPAPQTYYAVGYLPYGYGGYPSNPGFGGVGFPRFPHGRNRTVVSGGGIRGGISIGGGGTRAILSGGYGRTTITQSGSIAVSDESLEAPRTNLNAGTFPLNNFNAPRTNLNFGGIPYTAGILSVLFTLPTYENLTREELLARLRELEQNRAGLYARFEVLQDEARRNGVKID